MALTEIVRSGEIIEAEKSEARDPDHMEIWKSLYSTFSEEEANALYFSLKEEKADTDDVIFRQGKKNTGLYFLNQGEAKLIYEQEGNEFLLKTLNPGDFAGEETFFGNTAFCTTSMIALTPIRMHVLNQEAPSTWKESFPMLESKLSAFALINTGSPIFSGRGIWTGASRRGNPSKERLLFRS
jgi:CRP-like cAMP-binding protein